MSEEELEALQQIRDLVDQGQYRLTMHFRQRLAQRGVFWHDIVGILEELMMFEEMASMTRVASDGLSADGRMKAMPSF
jgi:hypothetical protein